VAVAEATAPFPVVVDAEHRVSEAYGVYNLLGDGLAAPSVFVIAGDGRILWSYIGRDDADRPTTDTILAQLP